VIGAAGLAALVDLVLDVGRAGSADLLLLGASDRLASADELVPVAAALGVLAGAALAAGVLVLVAARRRRSRREREHDLGEARRLETMRRLLEERVEMLSASVRELEDRQTSLRAGRAAAPPGVVGTEADTIVVLPEAPSDPS
jgi:hypothetical protein